MADVSGLSALKLRALIDAAYTTKGGQLTSAEADANMKLLADMIKLVNLSAVTKPTPNTLTESASVAWDWGSKYFDKRVLPVSTETDITLTLSNVIDGACHTLWIQKSLVADCVITLAGTDITFIGFNDGGLSVTPEITLSGAVTDYFQLTFSVHVIAVDDIIVSVATGLNAN